MILLLVVSAIWAFSFGLIKGRLAGLDPTAVAVARLVLSLAVFLPFLRTRGLGARAQLRLAAIGAVQFGAMYLLYQSSYVHLKAYQVALFTITTPLMVALIDAAAERRWSGRFAAAAALSVAGAGVVLWQSVGQTGVAGGFVLVQLANLCFAAGQIAWRRERRRLPQGTSDAAVFALPYAGAVLVALAYAAAAADWGAFHPSAVQWGTIAYLGVLSSGACFFLWNVGACRVNAGTLAAVNNAKFPLGVACSLLFFGEQANLPRLFAGGALMALALRVAGPVQSKDSPNERRA